MTINMNKVKKAALIAGIAAASIVPQKISAKKTTTIKNKKSNNIEITINPDELRQNIRTLEIDSMNYENVKCFANNYIIEHAATWCVFDEIMNITQEALKETKDSIAIKHLNRIKDAITQNEETFHYDFEVMLDCILDKELDWECKYIPATKNTSKKEISDKLAEYRKLLKISEQNQR